MLVGLRRSIMELKKKREKDDRISRWYALLVSQFAHFHQNIVIFLIYTK